LQAANASDLAPRPGAIPDFLNSILLVISCYLRLRRAMFTGSYQEAELSSKIAASSQIWVTHFQASSFYVGGDPE
jgi:hypothetical protein